MNKFSTLCMLLTLASCSSNEKELKNTDPLSDSLKVVQATEINSIRIDSVYNFAQTTDPEFCDKDSIMGTDCGFGSLYLTKKGNAIFKF